jgi:hypothetical protein
MGHLQPWILALYHELIVLQVLRLPLDTTLLPPLRDEFLELASRD